MKYLIDFYNTASDSDISTYLANNNLSVLAEWDNFDKVFLVEASTEPPVTDIVERVVLDEPMKIKPLDVIPVNSTLWTHSNPENEPIVLNNNDDKDWWKVYSYTQPNFESETTTISRKGKGVSVYIMDSGIKADHPEFVDANITNIYSITPGDFTDRNGHGTALASVISGKTCGITDAKLKIVKIFEPNHDTLQSEFLAALDAILADHADRSLSIVNCSWIIDKNAYVEHKLALLQNEGVYILAAAGNQGTSIEDVTPASMPQAITIGAYNKDLKPCDFSNYTGGSEISVTENGVNHGELDGWAPGEQIWAAKLDGSYGYVAGTSIATAICSAILANNAADSVDENGDLYDHYIDFRSDIFSSQGMYLFAREDILDLDDPKYSDCKNIIATIFDKSTNPNGQQKNEIVGFGKVGVSSVYGKLYENTFTKSIEFIDALPDNFTLLPDGILVGSPTVEQGPPAGQNDVMITVRYKRENHDDTIDDCKVDMYILGADVDPGSYPSDHPVGLKLQDECGFISPCIFYTFAFTGCGFTCPGNTFCCGGQKFSYAVCACTYSDRRLKTNIKRIGTHRLGIGLYQFDKFGKTEIGVMADEVLTVMPEAVTKGKGGYYKVNYQMIG